MEKECPGLRTELLALQRTPGEAEVMCLVERGRWETSPGNWTSRKISFQAPVCLKKERKKEKICHVYKREKSVFLLE